MATAFWCLVPRCGAGSLFHPVVAAWLMHISLGRWCQADPQTHCFIAQPVCGPIQISILVFLLPAEHLRVAISCVVLFADRRDIALSITERNLGICLSTYSVATPPLAAWTIPSSSGSWTVSEADEGQ